MAKTALFIRATTKPGKRDELRKVFEQHLIPHIEANTGQDFCFYCYGTDDENTVCMFEVLSEPSNLPAVLQSDWFKAYLAAAEPLLAKPTEVITTPPVWAKGAKI